MPEEIKNIDRPTRDGFGEGVVEAGNADERVIVLCADLAESTRADWFRKEFPDRYVEVGVAEQNLAALASGFAAAGKIPFITSYAAFNPGRNFEQIRTTIALNDVPVIVCGMHSGVSVGPDGATHQALEDAGLMRMLPNMTVVVPCDSVEAKKATLALAKLGKPGYLRLTREKSPIMTSEQTHFEIGHAHYLHEVESPQVTIIGMGPLLAEALAAAKKLNEEGTRVSVLNSHTLKPLDTKAIFDAAQHSGAVVTVEEHQVAGGLGSAVAEFLAENLPTPIEMVGVRNRFGQSGTVSELYKEYGLTADAIYGAAQKVLKRK